MYTPPHTKLRGDLQLELRDIKEKIAIENQKLELVQRKRSDSEEGFKAREKKVSDKEAAHAVNLKNIEKQEEEQERDIKANDIVIAQQTKEINELESDSRESREKFKIEVAARESAAEAYVSLCENRERVILGLDNQIVNKTEIVTATETHLDWLNGQVKKVLATFQDLVAEYREKNASLEAREKKATLLEKDVAIMSSQLIKKYNLYEPETKIEKQLSL